MCVCVCVCEHTLLQCRVRAFATLRTDEPGACASQALEDMVVQRFPNAASVEVKSAPRRGRYKNYARANQGVLTDKGIGAVARKLPALTALKLDHSDWVTPEGVRELSSCSSLTTLKLAHGYRLTDECVRGWKRAPALTSLNLSFSFNITAVGVRAVACMPTLTSIDLQFCLEVTDEAVRAVSKMPALTALNLSQCSITDQAVWHVSRMPALKALKLQGGARIGDEAMRAVSKMPALTSLHLTANICITDVGIAAVSTGALPIPPQLRQLGPRLRAGATHCSDEGATQRPQSSTRLASPRFPTLTLTAHDY